MSVTAGSSLSGAVAEHHTAAGFAPRRRGDDSPVDPTRTEDEMTNTIVWADIPVNDMDRARAFYGKVLQAEITIMEGSDGVVALLPMDPDGVGGDLVLSEESKPGAGGVAVYLNSNGDAAGMMARALDAGAEVLMPVSDMGEMVGSIGFFKDSEGNRIGVHQASTP
jgi:hypothetical protein